MVQALRSITWEAPEHHHVEKGNDWFFALAIIVVSMVVAAAVFGDMLFALLIVIAGGVLAMSAAKRPLIIPYEVSVRGVRIAGVVYPFPTLDSYWIDEEDPRGPQLLVKSNRKLVPLIVLPIPDEYLDDIDAILGEKLPEEHLQEPFLVKVLELFGL